MVVCQKGCAVTSELEAYYFEKMTEAEHNAAAAKDSQEHEKWRKIADGFRSLAGLPTGDQPTEQ